MSALCSRSRPFKAYAGLHPTLTGTLRWLLLTLSVKPRNYPQPYTAGLPPLCSKQELPSKCRHMSGTSDLRRVVRCGRRREECPVQSKFHINKGSFFSRIMSHAVFVTYSQLKTKHNTLSLKFHFRWASCILSGNPLPQGFCIFSSLYLQHSSFPSSQASLSPFFPATLSSTFSSDLLTWPLPHSLLYFFLVPSPYVGII